MRIVAILILVLILTQSCKTTKQKEETTQAPIPALDSDVAPEDMVFTLKKGGCFGTCPIYTLRIYKNQYVEFVGERHTNKLGVHGKMISKTDMLNLQRKFEEADFFSFEEVYPSNIPDLPSATLIYKKAELIKTVKGKSERPEPLHKLQFELERIAEGKEGWTLQKASAAGGDPRVKLDHAKVVVEIAKGNELPKWFTKVRKEYGVQILESLSPNNATWLITYNTKEYTPEQFMEILTADPVVKSAKFQEAEDK